MSGLQLKIYSYLPISWQNLLISAFGYYWRSRRFGGIFKEELAHFRKREAFSQQQWRDYQTIELRKLLIHAYDTVPFYKEQWSKVGFSVEGLRKFELEDLNKLPILTKEELRKFGMSTLLSSKREKGGKFYASSGSTGTPTQILYSNAFHQRYSAAFEARIRNWAGLTRFNSRGMIGGRRIVPMGVSKGPFYRYNLFEKQVYFSAYHISTQTAQNYAFAIKKFNLDYMTGYAMSNYFLARFFNESNIEVPKLMAVITSSEKLTPEMREMFIKVYGCKVYDSYSGVEACGLISENEYGQLLISPDVGIMEILDENGRPCKPGETGEIYSTGLLNFDQPLIRYRIGDQVKLGKNHSTLCGRSMTVIEEIVGRIEDTVIGRDGRKLVRFHGIFVSLSSIVEGQVIQHTIDDFEIKIVSTRKLTVDERYIIKSRMISQLGQINLQINEVPSIPRNQNGKFKAVISNLPQK